MELINDHNINCKRFMSMIIMFDIINGFLPITISIIYIFKTSKNEIENNDLYVPFECWLPFTINNIFIYLSFMLIQLIGLITFSFTFFCWLTTTVCSLTALQYDIKLLRIAIKNIDNWVHEDDNYYYCHKKIDLNIISKRKYCEMKNEFVTGNEQYEKKLHIYLINLIHHHQEIIR